jgi:hypothetical protein
LTLTLGCRASAPRRAWRQDPPARRQRRPAGVPVALACGGDDAAAIIVVAVAGPLLLANAANAGIADVVGRRYSPPLAVAPLLLRQQLLLLQLPWGVGVCVGIRRCCRRHCHGGNLAVIVAASAAIATAIGGGRTHFSIGSVNLTYYTYG